ncbi:undecaprenyl-diphosphatase UppP [Deltaproteobacteria bacterium TL4]
MMTWFQAAILGLVQGLTEFLPISSTAHLRIIPLLAGWEDPGTAFSAVIQLGTLVAVILYFREEVLDLIVAAIQSLLKRNLLMSNDSKLAWAIALGTIPVVVLGLSFKDFIENEARGLHLVGTSLIVLGILLYLAEKFSVQRLTTDELDIKRIQVIGLCQALALIPGCSRSGSTLMGGFLVGLNREHAARFSFLLGLPAIAGSGLFELLALVKHGLGGEGVWNICIGITTAFVSGYLTIGLLLAFLKRFGTLAFVIYRIILGTCILVFLA